MIKPLGDRVVIEPTEQQEKTESGIILPDTAQEKPQEGKVLAVGDCETIKKDDLVLYPKYSGTEINHKGKDVLIISEKEVLAVVG
jgi:chaperonin GroES